MSNLVITSPLSSTMNNNTQLISPVLLSPMSPLAVPMFMSSPPQSVNFPILSLPQINLPSQNEIRPNAFFMMQDDGCSMVSMNPNSICFDQNGIVIAPNGYKAVYYNTINGQCSIVQSQSLSVPSTPSQFSTPNSPNNLSLPGSPICINEYGVPVPTMGGNASEESGSESAAESSDSDKLVVNSEKKRKFPHRSKQKRIEEVEKDIVTYFTKKGIFVKATELRGEDTCRVHVKTYQALNKIFRVLKEIYNHEDITMVKLATPISMKNRFQKKGFIVYIKSENAVQRSVAQRIIGKYPEWFKNCEVARSSSNNKRRGYYYH